MTSEQFRQDANRVTELRTVLANPVLQEALLVIHDSRAVIDAPDTATELSSVRLLSKLAGRSEVIRELYEMATQIEEIKPPPSPTFGVTDPAPEGFTPDLL